MDNDLHPSRMAVVGVVLVALAAAGCSHTQAKVQRDTVTTESQPTTTPATTTTTRMRPTKKGEECVLAAGGEEDPARAMNECRETLARFYGVDTIKFQEAWQAAEGLATCLTYGGLEECLAATG